MTETAELTGRDLDAAVAREVCGFNALGMARIDYKGDMEKPCPDNEANKGLSLRPVYLPEGPCACDFYDKHDKKAADRGLPPEPTVIGPHRWQCLDVVRDYSTTWAGLGLVVEAMRGRGWWGTPDISSVQSGVVVKFAQSVFPPDLNDPDEYTAIAPTGPSTRRPGRFRNWRQALILLTALFAVGAIAFGMGMAFAFTHTAPLPSEATAESLTPLLRGGRSRDNLMNVGGQE